MKKMWKYFTEHLSVQIVQIFHLSEWLKLHRWPLADLQLLKLHQWPLADLDLQLLKCFVLDMQQDNSVTASQSAISVDGSHSSLEEQSDGESPTDSSGQNSDSVSDNSNSKSPDTPGKSCLLLNIALCLLHCCIILLHGCTGTGYGQCIAGSHRKSRSQYWSCPLSNLFPGHWGNLGPKSIFETFSCGSWSAPQYLLPQYKSTRGFWQ